MKIKKIKALGRRVFCIALTAVISIQPVYATPQSDYEANVRQQDEIRAQLATCNEKIVNIEIEANTLFQNASSIQEQLDEIDIIMTVIDTQLDNLETQLDHKYQEMEDQLHIYHMQIRYAEEYGSTSYWALIFSSSNVIELLNSLNFIEETIQYRQTKIQILDAEIKELESNIDDLANIRAERNYTAHTLQAVQNKLYTQIREKIAELTALENLNAEATFELEKLKSVESTLLLRMTSASYEGFTDATLLFEKYVVQTGEASRTPQGARLAAYALQYVGGAYVWGGARPETGFDCSGMMYYIYGQFGYSICRTARPQFKYDGRTVLYADLQAGDLVFFHPPGDPEISHVGMYIGGGMFVHAANSKRGIIVSSLKSGYYYTNFAGAKRII